MFNPQKRYFRKKEKGVQRMIWDLEFKRFKTLEIREDVRREYDQGRSRKEILQQKIESEARPGGLKEKDTDEFKRLEDQMAVLNGDIERHKKQMDGLDIEVHGAKPSAELPEGHQGITQDLDSLRELRVMINDYIREEL